MLEPEGEIIVIEERDDPCPDCGGKLQRVEARPKGEKPYQFIRCVGCSYSARPIR